MDTGVYTIGLTVTNEFGCTDNDVISIEIEPEFTFHPPNSFTPNDDDINETFMPLGIGLDNEFVMYIYDRWGDLIFETTDATVPWDGRANKGTKMAQEDVYVWVVLITDHSNSKHKFVGHVTLIR